MRVSTDSSAAIGISKGSGLGELRHLETRILWVQEKVRTGAIEVRKVRGSVSPVDLFTMHLPSKDKVHQLVQLFVCGYRTGRSEAAPLIRPQRSSGGKGGQPAARHLPTFIACPAVFAMADGEKDDQEPHDPSVLPHSTRRGIEIGCFRSSQRRGGRRTPMIGIPTVNENGQAEYGE